MKTTSTKTFLNYRLAAGNFVLNVFVCLATLSNSFPLVRHYDTYASSWLQSTNPGKQLSQITKDGPIAAAAATQQLVCFGGGTKCRRLRMVFETVDDESESFADDKKYPQKEVVPVTPSNVWEQMALWLVNSDRQNAKDYVQVITLLRIGLPSITLAMVAKLAYPTIAMTVANAIDDPQVFAVVYQDSSQFIQNILTISALSFSILVGQTYFFMYKQQEAIYFALFEEVSTAKSLLEQVSLVCRGREGLYKTVLACIERYVREDLNKFDDQEPANLISARPIDDPLEDILFLTSVGEPSLVYQTVRSLRQARAQRLGALQLKLPEIHMTLLWALFCTVLVVFPLLGSGSQTLGGERILMIQSWYLSFIVFGMAMALRVIAELREPGRVGSYNAQIVLSVMVAGLEEDLWLRFDQLEKMTKGEQDPFYDKFLENR